MYKIPDALLGILPTIFYKANSKKLWSVTLCTQELSAAPQRVKKMQFLINLVH